jgi:protein required for attachment to host cells
MANQAVKQWIVVVTRTGARVFKSPEFEVITTLLNPLGREKNRAMTTDKPGLAEKNPHEDAAVGFAKRIARYLHVKNSQNRFDELVIAAEPKMLGRLKAELDKTVAAKVRWWAKDLGKIPDADIGARLAREGELLYLAESERQVL